MMTDESKAALAVGMQSTMATKTPAVEPNPHVAINNARTLPGRYGKTPVDEIQAMRIQEIIAERDQLAVNLRAAQELLTASRVEIELLRKAHVDQVKYSDRLELERDQLRTDYEAVRDLRKIDENEIVRLRGFHGLLGTRQDELLEESIERVVKERDEAQRSATAWQESAAQFARNQGFYHGLITKIGESFGIAARTSDDGSIQEDVLALKVPELVDQRSAVES